MSRYPALARFGLSQKEKEANKTLGEGGAGEQAAGSTIGSLVGGGLGALGFLVPGLGAVTMPLGASLGGAAGGAIGGAVANDKLADAQKVASGAQGERQGAIDEEQARKDALSRYLKRPMR